MVEQLLNRRTLHGRTFYLVRWQGHDPSADSWEPEEHLINCPERIAEYELATFCRLHSVRRADPRASTSPSTGDQGSALAPSPPQPSAGWRETSEGPLRLGSTIMGLYWWPAEGWQLGRVARLTTRRLYTHVIR